MKNVQTIACNSVLTNSDLLYCIFAFVPAPLPGSLSRRDDPHLVAPCTTVCRAFHEPATRILWRELFSLFPLWHFLAPPGSKCPPFDFYKDTRSDYLHEIISARLYDDPIVWDRFLWHAARVRDITYGIHKSHAEIRAAQLLLIHAVLLQNGGKTILPSLRSIKWLERAPTDGTLIPFFTSTLRRASFSFASPPDEWPHALLLRRLRECAPFLQKIDISTTLRDEDNVDTGPQLLQEVLRLDRLREAEIHCIKGPTTFRNLFGKPDLVSLTISDVTGPWAEFSSQPPALARDLRKLSVGGTGPALTGFFREARFLALESAKLTLYIDSSPDSDSTKDIIDALAAFCDAVAPASHLVRSLDIYVWGFPTWSVALSLHNLLAPILQTPFHALRSFSFGAEELAPRIEDATVAALVSAWPKLDQLTLDCDSPSDKEALSVHALHYIHAHCHNLEKLVLRDVRCPAVGVQPVPEPLDRPLPHPLRHLSVDRRPVPTYGHSKVSDEAAEALARYLLELFPAVHHEGHKRTSDQATLTSAYKGIFFDRW